MPRFDRTGPEAKPSDNPRHASDPSTITGVAWMAVAILIWASWLVLSSSGRATELSPVDLAGFRALLPTLFLAPLMWRDRRKLAGIGLKHCLLLSAYGAPFTLCVGYGLSFAPVAHAGALVPGLMPVIAALLGWLILAQPFTRHHAASALLILLASAGIVGRTAAGPSVDGVWIGHVLFVLGAIFWASFALTMRTLRISPFLATAIVGAVSTVLCAPIWIAPGVSALGTASVPDILFQAVFQGILSGLVSLYAFGKALSILGPLAKGFTAFTPGVATLLAIPLIGETPDLIEVLALACVGTGLLIGSMTTRVHTERPRNSLCNAPPVDLTLPVPGKEPGDDHPFRT